MRNVKGRCSLRKLEVLEGHLCDLYEQRRKGKLKPACKHCKHFVRRSSLFFHKTDEHQECKENNQEDDQEDDQQEDDQEGT